MCYKIADARIGPDENTGPDGTYRSWFLDRSVPLYFKCFEIFVPPPPFPWNLLLYLILLEILLGRVLRAPLWHQFGAARLSPALVLGPDRVPTIISSIFKLISKNIMFSSNKIDISAKSTVFYEDSQDLAESRIRI